MSESGTIEDRAMTKPTDSPAGPTPRPSRHDLVLELLPLHAIGGLDAAESQRMDAHLAACAPCSAAYALERAAVDQLSDTLPMEDDVDHASSRHAARVSKDRAPDALRSARSGLRDRLRVVLWRLGGRIVLAGALALLAYLTIVGPDALLRPEAPEPAGPAANAPLREGAVTKLAPAFKHSANGVNAARAPDAKRGLRGRA